MKKAAFILLSIGLWGIGIAGDVRTIWQEDLSDVLPHGETYESGNTTLFLKAGRIVGFDGGTKVTEVAHLDLPKGSQITRAYYGMSPGESDVAFELNSDEVNMALSVLDDFSYREIASNHVYRVDDAGNVEAVGLRIGRMGGHLCTLGLYFLRGDQVVLSIDGHPDSEIFRCKGTANQVFCNDVLQAFLRWKMAQVEKEKDDAVRILESPLRLRLDLDSLLPNDAGSVDRLVEASVTVVDVVPRTKLALNRPIVIERPLPVLPVALCLEKEPSWIDVDFIVRATGEVSDISLPEETPRDVATAIRSAVARWKYQAGRYGGVRVNSRMRVQLVLERHEAKVREP